MKFESCMVSSGGFAFSTMCTVSSGGFASNVLFYGKFWWSCIQSQFCMATLVVLYLILNLYGKSWRSCFQFQACHQHCVHCLTYLVTQVYISFLLLSANSIGGLTLLVTSLLRTWPDIRCHVGVHLFFILFKAILKKVQTPEP